ncbi:hypothetical protein [Wolbachia endosymbiont (group A) of Pogonocherus hispidulus]|uniref:hypothetical protein n=1 Tax=Wolbachia endosymbiont (group A) of Pogonocherus hispidulus TaxID=3066136 RepID=UPI00334126B3
MPPFFVIPVPRLLGSRKKNGVMKVADTGSLYNSSAPIMSSQCVTLGSHFTL